MIVNEKDLEGYYNWKCTKCYHVFQIVASPSFQWKCGRPPTKRQNPNNAGVKRKVVKTEKVKE